jgi:ParB/RepB/Spo0J family partition protein
MPETRTVETARIQTNPGLRAVYEDSEQFAGLCRSVAAKGVIQDIEVRERFEEGDPNPYYVVTDGGHRFAAAVKVGLKQLQVKVVERSDDEVEEVQIELNLHKVDTKPIDYTKHLMRMLQRNPLMTKKELADKVNASESFIESRLGLLKLLEEIQAIVNNGDIPITSAQELANLPKEEQMDWLEDAIAQQPAEFVPAVKERLKDIRKAAREGKAAAPKTFQPVAKVRNKGEIEARFADAKGKERDTLAWVLQLDPETVAQNKADYEAKEAEKKENAAKKKAEREAAKAKEAAEKAEAAQAELAGILG